MDYRGTFPQSTNQKVLANRPSLPNDVRRPVLGSSGRTNQNSPMFMRSANETGFNPAFIDKRAFSPGLSSIGAAGYQDPGGSAY